MPSRPRTTSSGPVLSRRALSRATLQRQLLLRRVELPVEEAVERLVGLQAQVPNVPYLALWNRLAGFRTEELAHRMLERTVVRSPLMRTTIHTVTAADALALRPLLQPVLDRTFASTSWGQRLRGQDLGPALTYARALVEEQPRTRAELAPLIEARFPHLDGVSASWAFSYLVALVQPTPRGVWGSTGRSALTTVESWLGTPGTGRAAVHEVVLRYLRAFGPASVKDVQAWCGLTRLREVVDQMGTRLRRFRTEDGAELVDVPDGPLPDPDTPAPVRFLPEYDNALLSYADRSRVIANADHVPLLGGPGGFVGTVLVDGLVSATWAVRRNRGTATLEVRPSLPLPAEHRAHIGDEAVRLLGLLAPRDRHAVNVREP